MAEYTIEVEETIKYSLAISERALRSILDQVDCTLESVEPINLGGLVMRALDKGEANANKGFYNWHWLRGCRGEPDVITVGVVVN